MEQIIKEAIEDLKKQEVKGCITGSALLDYFEGQDIDLFVYNKESFTKLLYYCYYNPLYQLLDPLEKWKFEEWVNSSQSSYYKLGLVTIKFKYNLSVDVNIILRKGNTNIFSVLSNFDLDVICKGYDIETKQKLDLSNNQTKIVDWNKWNTSYYKGDIWTINKLLRQFERCIKYHNRGYNTDKVVLKYIELLDRLIDYENVFNSANFKEKLNHTKENALVLKKLFNTWLETHSFTPEEVESLKQKIKEL